MLAMERGLFTTHLSQSATGSCRVYWKATNMARQQKSRPSMDLKAGLDLNQLPLVIALMKRS